MELSCTSDNWEKRKPEKPSSTFSSIITMKPTKGFLKSRLFFLIGQNDLLVSVHEHTNYGSSQISGFDTRKHSGREVGVGKLQSSHLEKSWLKNMFNSISSFVKTHLVAEEKPECKCQQRENTVNTTQDLQHPLLDLLQPKTEVWSQVNIPPHKRLSQASGRGKTGPASPAYLQRPRALALLNPQLLNCQRPTPDSSSRAEALLEISEPSHSSTPTQTCRGSSQKSVNLLTLECLIMQQWVSVKPEHL